MLSSLYLPLPGGVSEHIQSLSRELVKAGHQVVVCTMSQQGLPEIEENDQIKIVRMDGFFQYLPLLFKDSARKWHPPSRDWVMSRKLARIIEDESPDIIHSHCWLLYSVLPLKNRFGIPLVHTIHDYGLFCPTRMATRKHATCFEPSLKNCAPCMARPYGLLRCLAAYYGVRANINRLKFVDKFIAVSDFVRDVHLTNLAIYADNILTIPNFTLPDADTGYGVTDSLPDDFILYVGWLMPHKGVDVLMAAYRRLTTPTKLLIIGIEHPDYSYRSAGNILVYKNAPRYLVMKAMAKCRFAVFPSVWPEPFGLVAIEAMSHAKAVIASNTGGLGNIIANERTGLLVTPNNPDKLADAISHLLHNPEESRQMGLEGYRKFSCKYSTEIVVPNIVALYTSLLKG